MKLNHLNLCVLDLSEAIVFFQSLLGFRLIEQKGAVIAVMDDGHGFTLVLSSMQANPNENYRYPKDFHLGFYVDTVTEVNEFHKKLIASGIASDPPKMMRGGYTLYFTALGGILFEVTCFDN
ncbi:VOC family protein [Paenibacillus ginsengarvi]|uniref:VOC family protein n=1 Tax=Paenibacillus ginsengarvi TaxID=400777 RepID=A0A3B0CC73_9BACL|nr:VOC family protein [Paenibacillus ginsengarvi]RKN83742.1 VOC family protein [Paenibacillus ginsengarvi]